MLVKTYSSNLYGISSTKITIEVNLGTGINFYMVGLPDNSVRESHQRIKSAFKNNGLTFPGREITINMAPADIKKEGTVFDLPIAIGILAVSKQLNDKKLKDYLMIGELSLDGSIQFCQGVLPRTLQAKKDGFKEAGKSKEFGELFRATVPVIIFMLKVSGPILLILKKMDKLLKWH